jgi:hypothetical protein
MTAATPPAATPRPPRAAKEPEQELAKPEEIDHALLVACHDGKLREIPILINGGANPNTIFEDGGGVSQKKITPLIAAMRVAARSDTTPKLARAQTLRVLKILIENGAAVRLVDRELVLSAINLDAGDILSFLIETGGARINRMARESMCVAMFGRRYEAFDTLRTFGIDPNIRDVWGSTPLLELCSEHPRLLQDSEWTRHRGDELWHFRQLLQLIRVGVDINAGDRIGATPVMRALVAGLPALARALIRAGANPGVMLRNGVSTMHLSAACADQDFLRFMAANEASFEDFRRLKTKRLQPDTRAYIISVLRAAQSEQAATAS